MSKISVTIEDRVYEIEIELPPNGETDIDIIVNGETIPVHIPNLKNVLERFEWLAVDGMPEEFVIEPDLHWIKGDHGLHCIEVRDMEAAVGRPRSSDGRIKAPIPGLISQVLVSPGDEVETGQPILVLEAMKMENELRATRNGVIGIVHVKAGQSVLRDEVLAEIE